MIAISFVPNEASTEFVLIFAKKERTYLIKYLRYETLYLMHVLNEKLDGKLINAPSIEKRSAWFFNIPALHVLFLKNLFSIDASIK